MNGSSVKNTRQRLKIQGYQDPYVDYEGGRAIASWIGVITLVGLLAILIAVILFAPPLTNESEPLDQWSEDLAQQYRVKTINETNWGEVIHQYEGYGCEAHRWQYRGVYYIGQVGWDCGDLIIEPTQR